MKKSNQTIYRAGITGNLLIPVLAAVIFLLSCNGGESKKNAKESPDANADVEALYDQTWVMKLRATSLDSIFSTGGGNLVKALKFTWITKNKRYALEVEGESEKGKTETSPFQLEIISSESPIKNPKGLKRNPQMVTRGDLKGFLGMPRKTPTPIPSGSFKDMYFIAHQSEDPNQPGKMLMYLAYSEDLKELIKTLAGSGDTKPSPPAPPCDTECDN